MWRRRWLDLLLLLILAPLGVWAWRSGRERVEAEATYARLAAAVGDLDIVDPSRIYLKAVPTGRPLQFAWRIYLPAGPFRHSSGWDGSGMSGSSTLTTPREGFIKISLAEREGGRGLMAHEFSEWSSGAVGVGDESLAGLLRGRWDRVEVEQAGAGRPLAAPVDKPLVLLRLKLPPDILAESRDRLSPYAREAFRSGFYESIINP